jgi:hypothetical protein
MNAYRNFCERRATNPRSASKLAIADVLYLVETGRMEMPDNLYQDFLYSWQDKLKYGNLRKEAQRQDGFFHLDSRLGMHKEASGA